LKSLTLTTKEEEIPQTKLYVTDLMNWAYCERLFYLKKTIHLPFEVSKGLVYGTLEHEARRILAKFLEVEYKKCKNPKEFGSIDFTKQIIDSLDYAKDLVANKHPIFSSHIENSLPSMAYRLGIEEQKRVLRAKTMAKRGTKTNKIIETLLPWKTEFGVGSTALGITGQIDQVFKTNKTLIPIDFKTHTSRFASYLWHDAHAEQLSAYAFLLELKFEDHKVKNGIIKYTQDLSNYPVKFSSKNSKKIVNHIQKARDLLEKGKRPERLKGADRMKCNFCYLKKICYPNLEWRKPLC